MKRAFVILGNGFTIDFLHYFSKHSDKAEKKIDVSNLFKQGDRIGTPWDKKPGFLSYKNCPFLWTLGARPSNTIEDSTALIEEIITCANMYFAFLHEPAQKSNRVELETSHESIYLKAYAELTVYLRHLFSCYNSEVSDDELNQFLSSDSEWGWLKFFKSICESKYENITFVTFNYDIWLERILTCLNIPFCLSGLELPSNRNIVIIKPHGSISFVPRDTMTDTYCISYNLSSDGPALEDLQIKYGNLTDYVKGAIIPPAGDSLRLKNISPWAHALRERAQSAAQAIKDTDDVVLCGISYWHVDRRELDALLINLDPKANMTLINPAPPRNLNAVLISIFSNYVQQNTSSEIGGILNG